jgi:hypothetical protein
VSARVGQPTHAAPKRGDGTLLAMRRVLLLGALAAAAAVAARFLGPWERPVPVHGDGHAGHEHARTALLRARIAAAPRRMQGEFRSVRGE